MPCSATRPPDSGQPASPRAAFKGFLPAVCDSKLPRMLVCRTLANLGKAYANSHSSFGPRLSLKRSLLRHFDASTLPLGYGYCSAWSIELWGWHRAVVVSAAFAEARWTFRQYPNPGINSHTHLQTEFTRIPSEPGKTQAPLRQLMTLAKEDNFRARKRLSTPGARNCVCPHFPSCLFPRAWSGASSSHGQPVDILPHLG